ncbi:MAG: FecR family protein [Gammaproteobacteria bacterium]
MRKFFFLRYLLALCLSLASMLACAEDNRGRVMLIRGAVTATDDTGVPRILRADSRVRLGEVVQTGADSMLQIVFPDRSMLHVKPDTQLKIEKYHFEQKQPESDVMEMRLLKGGMRSLTGLVGKRNPDKVKYQTPIATIGIRGTVLEINRAADGSINTIFDYGRGYVETGEQKTLVDAGEAANVGSADQAAKKIAFERPDKDPATLAAKLAAATAVDIQSISDTVCKELGAGDVMLMVAMGDDASGSGNTGATLQGLTTCLPVDVAANMLTLATYLNPEAAPEFMASAVKGGANVAIALESVLRGMEHAPNETVEAVVKNAIDLGLSADDARNILDNLSTDGICR